MAHSVTAAAAVPSRVTWHARHAKNREPQARSKNQAEDRVVSGSPRFTMKSLFDGRTEGYLNSIPLGRDREMITKERS